MAEWGFDARYIRENWTLEYLLLMLRKMRERKARECGARQLTDDEFLSGFAK